MRGEDTVCTTVVEKSFLALKCRIHRWSDAADSHAGVPRGEVWWLRPFAPMAPRLSSATRPAVDTPQDENRPSRTKKLGGSGARQSGALARVVEISVCGVLYVHQYLTMRVQSRAPAIASRYSQIARSNRGLPKSSYIF